MCLSNIAFCVGTQFKPSLIEDIMPTVLSTYVCEICWILYLAQFLQNASCVDGAPGLCHSVHRRNGGLLAEERWSGHVTFRSVFRSTTNNLVVEGSIFLTKNVAIDPFSMPAAYYTALEA